jgi:hypothetical protein
MNGTQNEKMHYKAHNPTRKRDGNTPQLTTQPIVHALLVLGNQLHGFDETQAGDGRE